MNKSFVVHYRNKYPKGSVHASDSGIDVFNADGEHCVALRKNGVGQLVDCSEELGCKDRHDLAPIPKDARVHKLFANGMIGKSEEADERESVAAELAAHCCGGEHKVPSIQDLHVFHNPKASPTSGYHSNSSWSEMKPEK